jgi:SOS regulatory protein LexA
MNKEEKNIEHEREKIADFYKKNRRMPTYSEIMKMFGWESKNSAFKLVKKLIEEKVLDQDSQGRLLPNKLFGEIPVLGLIEAGFPTPTEEDRSDTMSLDEYLIEKKESSFILEVKGDSMIEEGIKEGDLVIVERQNDAKDGEIVIAEVDGGWTMKYLRKEGGKVWLEPANKKYKPIYPENDLRIAAVVKGVVRKY